ncbi:MAG: FAD-dependent thymidylate synthase [Actinomycetota bacterium]
MPPIALHRTEGRVSSYAVESFTAEERDILRPYFTNLDRPVFGLVNLPEVVKGALFARYSRTHKSLRRLFLDEFVDELDTSGDATVDATVGLRRAEELYERVFFDYGDDSVAQLGGVHLACEQASNLLTKVLEWGRLMSYLEQSTRYLSYDARIGGRYRYHRPPAVLSGPLGARYVGDMDRLFDAYAALVPKVQDHLKREFPPAPGTSEVAHRQAIRARSFDAVRGLLPAASLSNVGIYGTGQGYEALLLRMRAHPLPEARTYADMMLTELRKVIPSFLRRVDLPDRGVAWSDYLETNRLAMDDLAEGLLAGVEPDSGDTVTLLDFDPDGETKLVAAMLYAHSSLSERQLEAQVAQMSADERAAVVRAYVGDRGNRRHKPGRALERTGYRFDVLSDYGAFRDLQRHRMLTLEWQPLTTRHGYVRPGIVDDAGLTDEFDDAIAIAADLHEAMVEGAPNEAAYAVPMAFRVRYVMQFNAREAMHMIELRSAPHGHPAYRDVVQQMADRIEHEAGHRLVAGMLRYLDRSEAELGRLESERRLEGRRGTP